MDALTPTSADHVVVVEGLRIASRVYGGGPRHVVLVHGLAISGSYFLPLAERLAPEWTVWVVDLPGTGRSSDAPRPSLVPDLARWLAGWVEATGLPPSVFVANSFGCQIVAEVALTSPQVVVAAVWLGPAMDDGAHLVRQALRLALTGLREPLALIRLFLRDVWRYGVLRAIETFRHAVLHPFRPRLAAVRAPVLVLRGERDLLATDAFSRGLALALPDGRYQRVPGAHAIHFERPEEVAEHLRPFLRSVDGDGSGQPG